MVRSTLRIIFFISISLASAESATFKELVKSQAEITPNISIFIKNLSTNEVIVSYRANKRMIPASNQKIITTLTSLDLLGSNLNLVLIFFSLIKLMKREFILGIFILIQEETLLYHHRNLKMQLIFLKKKI